MLFALMQVVIELLDKPVLLCKLLEHVQIWAII